MPIKKITKFNIKGCGTAPTDLTKYSCLSGLTGTWLIGDRNSNDSADTEGSGEKGVLLFLPFGTSKVCAPHPPFDTDDTTE